MVSRILVRLDSIQDQNFAPAGSNDNRKPDTMEDMLLDLLGDNAPKHQKLLSDAKKAIDRSEYVHAREILEEAKALDSNKIESVYDFMIVQSYYRESKYEEALEYYDRAIQLEPNVSSFFNNKGIALFALSSIAEDPVEKKQFLQRSIEAQKNAVKLDPKNETALVNLSIAYAGDCQIDLALSTLQSIASSSSPEVLYTYAPVYALKANISDAIDFLSRATEGDPKLAIQAIADDDFVALRNENAFKDLIAQRLGPEAGMAASTLWSEDTTGSEPTARCE